MRKFRLAIFILLMLALPCSAQTSDSGQVPVTAPSVTLKLSDPPTPVGSASVAIVGNPGYRTAYYWVVTNSLIGSSTPAGPFVLIQAPSYFTPSPAAGAVITWPPVPKALSYDVLRTWTNVPPTGACNCAVATAVTATSYTDTTETRLAYTVNPVNANAYSVTLTNKSLALGQSGLQVNGIAISTGANPVFNVINFGARGDGTSDDAPAIAAAVAAAKSVGGGTVYFPRPANYYRVHAVQNSPGGNRSILYFTGLANISFLGDGSASVVTGDVLNVSTFEINSSNHVRVSGLSISAPNGAYVENYGLSGGAAVRLSGCLYCEVDHVEVTGASEAGIYLTAGTQFTKVHHNYIHGTWAMGINEDDCSSSSSVSCAPQSPPLDNEIFSNTFIDAGYGVANGSIVLDSNGVGLGTNIHDNTISYTALSAGNTVLTGIDNNNTQRVTIANNKITGAPADCIAMTNQDGGSNISGNIVIACGGNGVHLYWGLTGARSQNINITNTNCTSVGMNCVAVDASTSNPAYVASNISGIQISNTISSCSGTKTAGTYHGVYVAQASGITVTNTTVDGCGTYTNNGIYLGASVLSAALGAVNAYSTVGAAVNDVSGAATSGIISLPIYGSGLNINAGALTIDNTGALAAPNGSINIGGGKFTVVASGNVGVGGTLKTFGKIYHFTQTLSSSAGTPVGSDSFGKITGLSAATSVTLTFASSTWTTYQSCTANPSVSLATQVYVSTISAASVTFNFPSLTGTLFYSCGGY